jgi:hypothetical protein
MMLNSPVQNLQGKTNPAMLRVGVAQAGCDPWVILMSWMPLSRSFSSHGLVPQVMNKLTNNKKNSSFFQGLILTFWLQWYCLLRA